jgi:hypothetical protein
MNWLSAAVNTDFNSVIAASQDIQNSWVKSGLAAYAPQTKYGFDSPTGIVRSWDNSGS